MSFGRSALGAVLLVVACGGTTDPQNTIEVACARLHATYTQNVVRCMGAFAADFVPLSLEADFVASCVGLASARGSLVQPADLDACTDTIRNCNDWGSAACLGYGSDLLFPAHDKRGSLPEGDTCRAGLQCASGVCNSNPGKTTCGVCVVPKAPGAACDEARDVCEKPTFCSGKRCSFYGFGIGESCVNFCAEPFYCERNYGDETGRCQPRGAPGAACSASVPFQIALACVAGECRAPLPEGAPCDASRDWCATEDRRGRGACVGGTCVFPRTGVQEGGACDPDAWLSCRADLTCRSQVCTSDAKVGAPCDYTTSCVPDAWCGPERRCIQLPGPGAPCLESRAGRQCASGAFCEGFHASGSNDLGTCRPFGGVGAPCPCSEALACSDGKCVAWSDELCR